MRVLFIILISNLFEGSLSFKIGITKFGEKYGCSRLWQRKEDYQSFSNNNLPLNPSHIDLANLKGTLRKSVAAIGFSYILLKKRALSVSADIKLCSDSLTHLEGPDGKNVFLIGTAHISEESANFVRQVINKVSPDVVMIELDVKRIGRVGESKSLEEARFDVPPQTLSELSERSARNEQPYFLHLFRQFSSTVSGWVKGAAGLLLGQALSSFYKSIEKLGFVAGGEFVAAVDAGRAIGSRILLGDRDVDVTLQRLSLALSTTSPERFLL